MNDIKNGEVKAECQHPGAEDDDEGGHKRWMGVKPFQNPTTFK